MKMPKTLEEKRQEIRKLFVLRNGKVIEEGRRRLEQAEIEKELEKIKEKEAERQKLAKKRQKKDVQKYKERVIDEAINVILLHIVEQAEEGPFQCPFCNIFPFETKDELTKHLKAEHPKVVEEYTEQIHQYYIQEENRRQQMRRRGAIIRLRRRTQRSLKRK